MIGRQDITGLVLAGGQGARMGGQDKGLLRLAGTPLALRALQRLRPQAATVLLSANRNQADYAAFGAPVLADLHFFAGHAGPLAGMLAGLAECRTPWLLTVPCDTPHFPLNLATRLADAAGAGDADLAVAADAGGALQPVFCLLRANLQPDLADYLASGGRKVREWMARHRCATVRFDQPDDDPCAFANANTPAELQALQAAQPLTAATSANSA